MSRSHDLIVVGAGPGGYEAAIRAAQLGLRTALVEADALGGTCLNHGCVPTKTLLHTAALAAELREADTLGLRVGDVGVDWPMLYARKEAVVDQLRSGIEQLIAANKIELLRGRGRLTAPGCVAVKTPDGERALTAENVLLATGARPVLPDIPGLSQRGVVTSATLLHALPEGVTRLLIVGGGVIGVEFASIFSSLGVAVTVVEAAERILPGLDREISQNLAMILKKRGVTVFTGARVGEVTREEALRCRFAAKSGEQTVDADLVLVAIGRRPNTAGLLADGVALTLDRGGIVADSEGRTSLPGVWAVGDCVAGNVQLAHVASAQGLAVVHRIAGVPSHTRLDLIPSCIYTEPEIASVGLTEEQAKAQGVAVTVGKALVTATARSLIARQERSFLKLVFSADDRVLRGAVLMCARATDLVGELTTAIANGLTASQLLASIRPHPTFTEALTEAVESLDGRAVHAPPKRK